MNSAGVKYEDHELDKLIFLEQGFAVSFLLGQVNEVQKLQLFLQECNIHSNTFQIAWHLVLNVYVYV